MPRYMLDTKMCIYLMKNQPEEVARRFAKCYVGDVVMSSITYAELEYGVVASANPERERINLASLVEDIQVIPFDAAAATAYGPIRLATRDGSRKDALDKLIAAHAASLKVTVVTNNEKDFSRYPGVSTENWLESPLEVAPGNPQNH
ncbi:MAG: type II toxin-antitoxin system VapC family toxin [Rhodocyclaceae bacterium]